MQKTAKKAAGHPITKEEAREATRRISSSMEENFRKAIRDFEDRCARKFLEARNNAEFDSAFYYMEQERQSKCPYAVIDDSLVSQDNIRKGKDGKYVLPNLNWKKTREGIRKAVSNTIGKMGEGAEYLARQKGEGNYGAFIDVSIGRFAGFGAAEFNEALSSEVIAEFGEKLAKEGIVISSATQREEGAAPTIRMSLAEEGNEFTRKR
ncbi:hypothetical protein JW721_05170 [Candidatus Micrarchaeota archaeon]|nr:hypothetical protein [Candidatus Micrarchaeota archaeon]